MAVSSGLITIRRQGQRGFTLVEILIVVVIIGSLASLAVLNLGGGNDGRVQEEESKRLHAMLRMAADLAILESREIGLLLERDRYQFLELDAEALAWREIEETGYGEHPLPAEVAIELGLEGGESRQLATGEGASQPSVILFSSGEITPFEISVSDPERRLRPWLIRSDGFSAIELTQQEAEL